MVTAQSGNECPSWSIPLGTHLTERGIRHDACALLFLAHASLPNHAGHLNS